jgi:hypothetical protein
MDLGAGLVTDIGVAVENPGHGSDGNAGVLGNIINIQFITSL